MYLLLFSLSTRNAKKNLLYVQIIHKSQPNSLITLPFRSYYKTWVMPMTIFLMWQLIVTARSGRTEYQLLLMNVSWWDRNVKVIKQFGCDLRIIVRKFKSHWLIKGPFHTPWQNMHKPCIVQDQLTQKTLHDSTFLIKILRTRNEKVPQ